MGPLVDTCDLRWETLSEWLNSARGVSPAQNCGYEWSRSVERDQYLGICVWSGSRYSTGLIHWIMHIHNVLLSNEEDDRREEWAFQGKQVLETINVSRILTARLGTVEPQDEWMWIEKMLSWWERIRRSPSRSNDDWEVYERILHIFSQPYTCNYCKTGSSGRIVPCALQVYTVQYSTESPIGILDEVLLYCMHNSRQCIAKICGDNDNQQNDQFPNSAVV